MHGSIHELVISSTCLQENIPLLVYLPSVYTPLYKHTLVIAQDGKDYLQFGKVGSVIETLLMKGKIDRTIFVGIPYKDKYDRMNKYHPNGKQNQAYIRFLAHELAPFLDERYPTHQMGNGRVLLGDSLGATVSLLTSLMYPHTFGKAILQSPYVDETVLNQARAFAFPHLLDLYHVIGKEEQHVVTTDGTVQNFITPNRELKDVLIQKNGSYYYNEFQGNHTWKYWQEDLPSAFSTILL